MLLILNLYIREELTSLIFYISSNSCGSSCNTSCTSNCYSTCSTKSYGPTPECDNWCLSNCTKGCLSTCSTGCGNSGCYNECTNACITSCGNSCGPLINCGGRCASNGYCSANCLVGCELYCLHNSCSFSCGGDQTIDNVHNCVGLCTSSSCSATGRE